jgi:hypothetical protein
MFSSTFPTTGAILFPVSQGIAPGKWESPNDENLQNPNRPLSLVRLLGRRLPDRGRPLVGPDLLRRLDNDRVATT